MKWRAGTREENATAHAKKTPARLGAGASRSHDVSDGGQFLDPATELVFQDQGLLPQLAGDQVTATDRSIERRPAGSGDRTGFFDGVSDLGAHAFLMVSGAQWRAVATRGARTRN